MHNEFAFLSDYANCYITKDYTKVLFFLFRDNSEIVCVCVCVCAFILINSLTSWRLLYQLELPVLLNLE